MSNETDETNPRSTREDMSYLDIEQRDFQMLGSSEALAKLFAALAAATSEFTPIHKNRQVTIKSEKGTYSFVYAELSESIDATRPALAKNGLAVVQPYTKLRDVAILRTVLSHSGGGLLVLACEIPRAQNIKDLGGSLTYLRRYTYNALLCLAADEDLDDQPDAARGETGAQSGPRRTPEVPAQAPKNKPLMSTREVQPANTRVTSQARSQPEMGPGQIGYSGPKASPGSASGDPTGSPAHNQTQASPNPKAEPAGTGQRTAVSTESTPATSPVQEAHGTASSAPATVAGDAPTPAGSPTGPSSTTSAGGSPAPQTSSQPSGASPASPSHSSASPDAGSDEPASEEQKLKMHALLEAMRVGRPARNGYVADIMASMGISGRLTVRSANSVLAELEKRKAEFLANPGI